MPSVTIDVVSFDPVRDQYALHLVEGENSPDRVDERRARLKAIQDRVFSAVDAAIDGQLAGKYPETLGRTVRIQVDCAFAKNDDIELVVSRVADYLSADPDLRGSNARPSLRIPHRLDVLAATRQRDDLDACPFPAHCDHPSQVKQRPCVFHPGLLHPMPPHLYASTSMHGWHWMDIQKKPPVPHNRSLTQCTSRLNDALSATAKLLLTTVAAAAARNHHDLSLSFIPHLD